MKSQVKAATLAAIDTNTIFGFSYMFSRLALQVTGPETMLMARFVLAFLVINVIVFFVSRRKDAPAWLRFHLRGKKLLPLISLGLLQPVAYFLCESNGVSRTNATISGVIIALVPILGIGLGRVILREKVRPLQLVFAFISIVGVIMMIDPDTAPAAIQPIGILFLLGSAFSGAVFHILSRKAAQTYSALERTYVMMGTGAVTFTVISLAKGVDTSAFSNSTFLLSILYLSVLSSIAAFLLLNYANTYLPVARYTAFTNLSTVLSLFAGVVFLGEPCGIVSLIASVLIVGGVIGVQKFATK